MIGRPLIAVVDDEESVRRALARMLNASHFAVELFASGGEFLDAARRRRHDCVVLDYQMPGLTGRDVQRRLAAERNPLPVVVVTAHDHQALREQCLAEGAAAYLSKPLHLERLIRAIDGALQGREEHPASPGSECDRD
jgi:FixJ family two-component response regulator